MSPSLYFHTIRFLKPAQILGRALKLVPRGQVPVLPAPPRRRLSGPWQRPVERPRSLFADGRVRFLNLEGSIATPAQWNDPAREKLWLYNLHYFDDLTGAAGGTQRKLQQDLLARWIAENPVAHGNGWEPYPVSLRTVNWIKWSLAGGELSQVALDSLATQVRWLARHLEWHLLGNHLLANAKALIFAGLYFDGGEADGWLAKGVAIYAKQLPEQILADGGHFELSAMYHAIILDDLLDVLNLARASGKGDWPVRALPPYIHSMRTWLAVMTHPDGGPPFFNDCAFGIAANRSDLENYAARLELPPVREPGDGIVHLEQSGYIRIDQRNARAFLDVAAIGPGYLPGHAHADTLSFELSIDGRRVLVNGGTSTYQDLAQRASERATAAHNTVEIGGESSSETWGAFRVARRARVRVLDIQSVNGTITVTASHDGYRRLAGHPLHTRRWQMSGRSLTVMDTLSAPVRRARANYHFAPGHELACALDGLSGRALLNGKPVLSWDTSLPGQVTRSQWSPQFGLRQASQSLSVRFYRDPLISKFDW